MQTRIDYPMRLTVTADQSRKLIENIQHKTCRNAVERCWSVTDDGKVSEESVNWLFCWGKTGMGSRTAAEEAKRVFDAILPVTFSRYDDLVAHEHARKRHYTFKGRRTDRLGGTH